jgi:hypothetical protein
MQAVSKFKATQLSGGYISVHWRFEKTVKAHTFKILPALIHYIKQKAADTGISHVRQHIWTHAIHATNIRVVRGRVSPHV